MIDTFAPNISRLKHEGGIVNNVSVEILQKPGYEIKIIYVKKNSV
jgi:hypothetical protein